MKWTRRFLDDRMTLQLNALNGDGDVYQGHLLVLGKKKLPNTHLSSRFFKNSTINNNVLCCWNTGIWFVILLI